MMTDLNRGPEAEWTGWIGFSDRLSDIGRTDLARVAVNSCGSFGPPSIEIYGDGLDAVLLLAVGDIPGPGV